MGQLFMFTGTQALKKKSDKQYGYIVHGVDLGHELTYEADGYTSFGHECVGGDRGAGLWLPIAKKDLFDHNTPKGYFGVYELEIATGLSGGRNEIVSATWVYDVDFRQRKAAHADHVQPLALAK